MKLHMKILMKIGKGFGWRAAVIVSVLAWALFSWGLWIREGVFSPLHCLILGAMMLALALPVGMEILKRKKWFYAAMSMWFLVIIPAGMSAFNASVGHTVFPQRFYIALGVFGCVSTLAICISALRSRDKTRAQGRPEKRDTPSRFANGTPQ